MSRFARGSGWLAVCRALLFGLSGSFLSAEGPPSAREAQALRELESSFRHSFLEHWYPLVVDWEQGGYLSSFDADWKPTGSQDKFIVSQARHLWMTAQVAAHQDDERYARMAEHGFRYLKEVMWDERYGGFHSRFTRDGRLLGDGSKSAYGNAFALYALSSYYALTRDPEARELMEEAFNWMEEHSWDHEFGGYVDKLKRDGAWAGTRRDNAVLAPAEHVGLKDYNSSIHLLEALTALYQVWDDDQVRRRLADMLRLVRDRFTTEQGYLRLYYFRDWTPLSHRDKDRAYILKNAAYDHVSWGHDVETAFLMLEASHALGGLEHRQTLKVARKVVDHALATGWDEQRGGLAESGYYFEGGDGVEVISEDKIWWVAAESMNALLMMSQLFPEDDRYREAFHEQWDYIKAYLIDKERGGWYPAGLDTNPEAQSEAKAHIWKTSYHDGRAYLNCIRMLKGEFELTNKRPPSFRD